MRAMAWARSFPQARPATPADIQMLVHGDDDDAPIRRPPNFQISGKGIEFARTRLDIAAPGYASCQVPDQR